MNGPIGRRRFVQSTVGAALATGARNSEAFEADNEPRTESMKSFRVAAVASRSLPASPESNLEHCAAWTARAAQAGAALVCFPELSITGYVTTPEIWTAAEPVPGPSTEKLAELARKAGLIVAAGIAEKDRDIVYDTYVFVGPNGYLGKSRKIHIPPAEVGYWRGGGVPPVIDIGLAKVGVNVCFDNWLPESSRLVALQGAEVLFAPYVWAVGEWGSNPDHARRNRAWKDYARRTFPARSIDNGLFLVAVNACGPVANGSRQYNGNPVVLIYSPHGQLVGESPDEASEEVMVLAELRRELLVERRSQAVFHPRFRRPELYGMLCEGDTGKQSSR
jgi:predicted amidohydrolase